MQMIKQAIYSFFKLLGKLKYLWLTILGTIGSKIFAPFDYSICGYLSLVLFLGYMYFIKDSYKKVFFSSYAYGAGYFVLGFVWVNNALLFGGDTLMMFIPLIMLITGLFFGLFFSFATIGIRFSNNIYSKAISFTVLFVLLEWIRSFIFTGFPWNLLGSALSFSPKLIVLASYIGTYGLSILLLLLLSGIGILLYGMLNKKFYIGSLIMSIIPALFLLCGYFSFNEISDKSGLRVRLVQPSIEQSFKWDESLSSEHFRKYIDLSNQESLEEIDIVVWGETASPYYLERDIEHLSEITQAIPDDGYLITGTLRIGVKGGYYTPYNSMYVINKQGDILDYYDKSHLVPFGEYLPFREYLPDFMSPIANIVGDLGIGEKYKNLRVSDLPLLGGAICYESIFPKGVINKEEKPELLFVLVNDGWYGISSGPYQHLSSSQMRAVEEGITVVRSANTGVSTVILNNGQILDILDLEQVGYLDISLPQILSRKTIYNQYGNSVVFILLLVLSMIFIALNKYNNKYKK